MSKQTFIKGALILIVAGMISRLLGFVNRMVMARLLGEEGVGIYMLTVPALLLMITLSQVGIPVAVSKLVSEAVAINDRKRIKKILYSSFTITVSLSIVLTIFFALFIPVIAERLLLDERTLLPMLVMSPIIIIIAISSVLRGYFQGLQNMKPQAFAQVIEQVIRIVLVVIMIKLLLPFGLAYAAAGAMGSAVLGELASLAYIFYCFKRSQKRRQLTVSRYPFRSLKNTYVNIFQIALPTAGSRMIGSITYFFEPILVSQSLFIAGYTVSQSTSLYGQLTGFVMPLLLLPTFITHSLSVALIPSVSESNALKHHRTVHFRITQALRLSFVSGGLATILFMLLSASLLQLIYGTNNGAEFLKFMAPFFILLYFQAPLQAALQALNYAKHAMINSLIGAMVKLSVLWLLATNPNFGIDGVILSVVVGILVVTLLHFAALYRLIRFKLPVSLIIRMGFLLTLLYIVGNWIVTNHSFTSDFQLILVVSVSLGIMYLIGLLIMKLVTIEEWRQLFQRNSK